MLKKKEKKNAIFFWRRDNKHLGLWPWAWGSSCHDPPYNCPNSYSNTYLFPVYSCKLPLKVPQVCGYQILYPYSHINGRLYFNFLQFIDIHEHWPWLLLSHWSSHCSWAFFCQFHWFSIKVKVQFLRVSALSALATIWFMLATAMKFAAIIQLCGCQLLPLKTFLLFKLQELASEGNLLFIELSCIKILNFLHVKFFYDILTTWWVQKADP